MVEQALLGFDFGEKKIGVAIGNTLTKHARALEIIYGEAREPRFTRIAALLKDWQTSTVIVGLALDADGAEQAATARCRRFANQLHGRFGVTVILIDERGSSIEAQEILGNNQDDDAEAAAVILQRYLDGQPAHV